MSLTLPPSYVPLPVDIIEQAYAPDKPHRVLFASFIRLLALAWQNKYERTPRILEEELYNTQNPDGTTRFGYLKLSRRQYFEQKADMEGLGWLRSVHPVPGFVQFTFSRSIAEQAPDGSAEKRMANAEKRTELELKRIEEEDSLKSLNTESSSSSPKEQVRKTAQVREILIVDGFMVTDASKAKMQVLLEHLHLLFDPEICGVLDVRDDHLTRDPEQALGWIAKAFQDRSRLTQGGGPIGLIVLNISRRRNPPRYFLEHYVDVLSEDYLEAIGEIDYECDYCEEHFPTRAARREHEKAKHPFPCAECSAWFDTFEKAQAHYQENHDPYRAKKEQEPIPVPVLDGSIERVWQTVLAQLQMEMPRASFDTWVRDTKVIRYDGNALSIGTRNAYAQDWLASRLTSTVERLLSRILDKPVTVQFVVSKAEVES